jgi:hypothetical protein
MLSLSLVRYFIHVLPNTTHCVRLVEVAIHTILYVRQVYPADIFVRRKKYDTPVFQSRHPSLNDYISGAVKAIGEELVRVSLTYIQISPVLH